MQDCTLYYWAAEQSSAFLLGISLGKYSAPSRGLASKSQRYRNKRVNHFQDNSKGFDQILSLLDTLNF